MSAPLETLGLLLLEDGRRWADAAEAFQLEDVRAVLDGDRPYHFLTRSRGGSKTTDLAACALALLLAADVPDRLYWLAADQGQGALAVDVIAGFLARMPVLAERVKVEARRVRAVESGATLDVLAADAPGAWGLRPAAVFCDELAWWSDTPAPRRLWEAVSSAVAKRPDARLVVLTTAGDPAHFAAGVLDHARRSDLWRVHEVAGSAPWLDPVRLDEQRARLSESMFARLFLNRWTEAEDRLTSAGDLASCVAHEGPLEAVSRVGYAIGVDIGLKRDRTACAVCHLDGARVVLDRLAVWQGSRLRPVRLEAVEEWLKTAARDYNRAQVIADPYQAEGLAQRLQAAGVRVELHPFTAQSVGRLAATLYGLLRDQRLALPDDPELLDELAHVRIRETAPGTFRIDHDSGRHDDRAIALALSAAHLLREPQHGAAEVGPAIWTAGASLEQWHPEHDDSAAHRAWAREHPCEQCREEARNRRRPPPPPPPRRVGKFLIHNQRRSP